MFTDCFVQFNCIIVDLTIFNTLLLYYTTHKSYNCYLRVSSYFDTFAILNFIKFHAQITNFARTLFIQLI